MSGAVEFAKYGQVSTTDATAAEYRKALLDELGVQSMGAVRRQLASGQLDAEQVAEAGKAAKEYVNTQYGEGTSPGAPTYLARQGRKNQTDAIGDFYRRVQDGEPIVQARDEVNKEYGLRIPREAVNAAYASGHGSEHMDLMSHTEEPLWRYDNPNATPEEQAEWRRNNLSKRWRETNPVYQGDQRISGGTLSAIESQSQQPAAEPEAEQAPAPGEAAVESAREGAPLPPGAGEATREMARGAGGGQPSISEMEEWLRKQETDEVSRAYTQAYNELNKEEGFKELSTEDRNRRIAKRMRANGSPAVQKYLEGQKQQGPRLYKYDPSGVDPDTTDVTTVGTMPQIQRKIQERRKEMKGMGGEDGLLAQRQQAIGDERERRSNLNKELHNARMQLESGEMTRGGYNEMRRWVRQRWSVGAREHANKMLDFNKRIRSTGSSEFGYAGAQGQSRFAGGQNNDGTWTVAWRSPTSGQLTSQRYTADSFQDAKRMAARDYDKQLDQFRGQPQYDLSKEKLYNQPETAEGGQQPQGEQPQGQSAANYVQFNKSFPNQPAGRAQWQARKRWLEAKHPKVYENWKERGRLPADQLRKIWTKASPGARKQWQAVGNVERSRQEFVSPRAETDRVRWNPGTGQYDPDPEYGGAILNPEVGPAPPRYQSASWGDVGNAAVDTAKNIGRWGSVINPQGWIWHPKRQLNRTKRQVKNLRSGWKALF